MHTSFAGELDGIVKQIDQNLIELGGVAKQWGGQGKVHFMGPGKALVHGPLLQSMEHFLHRGFEVKRRFLHHNLASFNGTQIQDVIDQVEQLKCAEPHVADIATVGLFQIFLRQQFSQAHNHIQRRSHFMAHDRQELGLGLGVGFRPVAGHLQFIRAFLDAALQILVQILQRLVQRPKFPALGFCDPLRFFSRQTFPFESLFVRVFSHGKRWSLDASRRIARASRHRSGAWPRCQNLPHNGHRTPR